MKLARELMNSHEQNGEPLTCEAEEVDLVSVATTDTLGGICRQWSEWDKSASEVGRVGIAHR